MILLAPGPNVLEVLLERHQATWLSGLTFIYMLSLRRILQKR